MTDEQPIIGMTLEERIAARKTRERLIQRRVNRIIVAGIALFVLAGGFYLFVGEGEDPGRQGDRPAPTATGSPSPTIPHSGEIDAQAVADSAAQKFASGSTEAAVAILQNAAFVSGCELEQVVRGPDTTPEELVAMREFVRLLEGDGLEVGVGREGEGALVIGYRCP